MKKLIFFVIFLPLFSFSQTFFVEKTDSKKAGVPVKIKVEETINFIIKGKLAELGKEVTNEKNESDYIVKPVLIRKSGYAKSAKGYIAFIKTDSGKEVLRSQVDKGMRILTQGMKNPFVLCFDRIITKQFPGLLPLLRLSKEEELKRSKNEPQEITKENAANELKKLKELLDAGILSQEEYDKKVAKENAANELKKLKELLDVGILSQEEYDKKAESLKKILLGN